ncbi:heavy-metal-associated domain-containing protein [Parvularcula sp. IMCC14364]|uniref:heavy-metal-associated domain-containing protein n=1 Tax=Parvularcula sp. IMCC14364 TaxID=3067902 RepID=UPI002742820F|nr:heavy-metal-associated domain-containing protein [Parvularcula sp. IMCC14364]
MRNLFTFVLSTIAATALVAASPALSEEVESRPAAEIVSAEPDKEGRIIQATVDGMVCDFCAQSLTKVLMREDAVESVQISLEAQFVTITVKDGMSLSDEAVEKAIYWAGYDLTQITRA